MRVGLVAPADTSCLGNPGWHMITAGIRWLTRQAVPDASFITLDMIRDDAAQWQAAQQCEALILCGNPRFSLSEDSWWECGIWERLHDCAQSNVRVVDGWGGACVPIEENNAESMDGAVERLMAVPRMSQHLSSLMSRTLWGAIARDELAERCYEDAFIESTLLPCSSWWAARSFNLRGGSPAIEHPQIVVVMALPDHDDWLPDALRALAKRGRQRGWRTPFIATTWWDFEWARRVGLPDVRLVTDPESLLRLYASTSRVYSFRVHASIPAASVGCSVLTFAVDSRALVCKPFGLPVLPFTDLREHASLRLAPQPATDPHLATSVDNLRRLLTSC